MKDTKKLFYKYLVIYFGLFLILVLGSFMITGMTEQIIWDDLIDKEELRLEKGSLDFERMIAAMRTVNDNLSSNESIRILNKEKNILDVQNFVEMNYVKKQFGTFRFAGGLPYGFILFRDNPVFISDSQVSPDYEEYYSQYLSADSYTASEFKELIFSQPDIVSFIRLNTIKYFDNRYMFLEDPVLVVLKPMLNSGVVQEGRRCVFILPQVTILDYFLVDDLLNDAVVRMYDFSGQVVVQHGGESNGDEPFLFPEEGIEDKGYQFLHTKIANDMLSFYVGVPHGSISGQVQNHTKGIHMVLLFSIIYTVFAVAFLVWGRYKPTKKMLEYLYETSDEEVTASNEYEYVKNTVDKLSQTRKELQRQFSELKLEMNNSILVNLLSHGIVNEPDKDKIKDILPRSLGYYFVILFHLDEIGEENPYEVAKCLIYSFAKYYGEYTYAVRMNLSEEVFIVPLLEEEQIDMDGIEKRLKDVAHEVTRQKNVVFNVGISGIGKEIETLNLNYEQAYQAYIYTKRDCENTIGSYSKVKLEMGNGSLEVTLLFQIYDFILMGNKEAIWANLDKLVQFCERIGDYQQNKEFFYTLSRILSSAYETLGIDEEKEKHVQWNGNICLRDQIEVLRERINQLIDAYQKSKKSHNTELKDNIIQYMEEHFCDVNLTVAEVCEAMHISEKYLTQFLKEQTLKTFSKYLEELRINKAKEYLADTQWSNKKIAEATGFGSLTTFYRVFNKVEGMSPANWKKAYMDNKGILNKRAKKKNSDE